MHDFCFSLHQLARLSRTHLPPHEAQRLLLHFLQEITLRQAPGARALLSAVPVISYRFRASDGHLCIWIAIASRPFWLATFAPSLYCFPGCCQLEALDRFLTQTALRLPSSSSLDWDFKIRQQRLTLSWAPFSPFPFSFLSPTFSAPIRFGISCLKY